MPLFLPSRQRCGFFFDRPVNALAVQQRTEKEGRIGNRVQIPSGPATVSRFKTLTSATARQDGWEGRGRHTGSQETCLSGPYQPSKERGSTVCSAQAFLVQRLEPRS